MEQASADVVIPAGFEPDITGLRILRPIRLDEGTMSARLTGRVIVLYDRSLRDHPDLKSLLKHEDLIHRHIEDGSEHDHVIKGRHGLSPLPLVDGLRGGEAEDRLKIADSHPGILPEPGDV